MAMPRPGVPTGTMPASMTRSSPPAPAKWKGTCTHLATLRKTRTRAQRRGRERASGIPRRRRRGTMRESWTCFSPAMRNWMLCPAGRAANWPSLHLAARTVTTRKSIDRARRTRRRTRRARRRAASTRTTRVMTRDSQWMSTTRGSRRCSLPVSSPSIRRTPSTRSFLKTSSTSFTGQVQTRAGQSSLATMRGMERPTMLLAKTKATRISCQLSNL
mmetsp:Transcript_3764/g.9543  ORF Transcript_3764/g.9543 Transcript_3764/m.9543 type:complete len:216 (-) Transcript_3764:1388-2035(-)